MAPPKVTGTDPNQNRFNNPSFQPTKTNQQSLKVCRLSDEDKNLLFRQNSLNGGVFKLNLFSQFNQANPAVKPALNPDPKKVDDAVKAIKSSLDQGFTDWDVTHGDLKDIQKTFQNLTAEEANEVFKKLSDGNIRDWMDELGGFNGGFGRGEKQQLFKELAGKLNGENLARLGKFLGNDGFDYGDLGRAIAQNAGSDAKVDFVKNTAGSVEKNRAAAEAVAEVISGLSNDPTALDNAVSSLNDTQFQKLMENISVHGYSVNSVYGSAYTIEYKGELLGKMLDAVSKSNNAELKAKVFNAAALHLKSIEDAPNFMPANAIIGKDDAAKLIRDGLTKVINSDTTGIVNQLTFDPGYRNGDGITAYFKSMLKGGKTEEVGNLIAKLAKGNDLTSDQTKRFQQYSLDSDQNKVYENAQMLGYFTGALIAANKQVTSDTEKQADFLKKIFSTAAGKIGVEGFGAVGFDYTLDQITKAVVDDLSKGRTAKVGELLKATFPQLAGKDAFYRSEVFSQYEARADHVYLFNK